MTPLLLAAPPGGGPDPSGFSMERLAVFWRTGWDVHPSLLAGVALVVGLYVGAALVRRQRTGRAPTRAQGAAFALGIAALLVALQSPLHHLSDEYLFSAHMAQHKLLILVVAPLLLLGTPDWMARPLVARRWVAALGRSRAYPVVAFAGFNLAFAFAHFPAIYDGLFATELAHRLTHVAILSGAIFTWLPLLSPVPDVLPRLPLPGQMLYCFVQSMPGALVGSLLTLSDRVLYRHYAFKPLELGVAPVTDQQLGGLLMWVVGGTYWLLALTVIFFVWADREERRAAGRPGPV